MYNYTFFNRPRGNRPLDPCRASFVGSSGGLMLSCLLAAALSACGGDGFSDGVVQEANAETRIAQETPASSPVSQKPTESAPAAQAALEPGVDNKSQTTGLINSVDAIIGDMSLENDAKLDGIPNFLWATGPQPAAVLMGSDPRGCKMQSWWLNMSGVKAEYKDCDLWTTYIQWFVIYEGVGNAGSNVRVETRNPKTYYLSKRTGKWLLLGEHASTSWFLAAKSNILGVDGALDKRTNADGSVSIKIPVKSNFVHHGIWPLGKKDVSSIVSDIAALYSTVQARLVVDDANRPDDRSKAILLMNSGADFYPNQASTAADSFPPGVGTSRTKRITNDWQAFNFATISAARQDYVGASASISTEAFRMNPPPLD